jgi:hypothetical protein
MNNIEPKYVTFEQAKWLKEIGFNVTCDSCYVEDWSKERLPDSLKEKVLSNPHTVKGTKSNNSDKNYISRPEQWQVVEWLRVNHNIWVLVDYYNDGDRDIWFFNIKLKSKETMEEYFNSPQEAYSAAFDYIKDNNFI